MTISFRSQVVTAFEVLAEGLAPFVDDRMRRAFPDEDWILMAAHKLGKRRDVIVSLSDPHFQLEVLNRWWGPVFAQVLPEHTRSVIADLRTARNHWAHPDPSHPFDFDYALKVHLDAEDLLRAVGSPAADHLASLADGLRWADVRERARAAGTSEADALMAQLGELQEEYAVLQAQLEEARAAAQTAAGRSRAVTRQLAELQTQYAAVAGLRDQYEELESQLREERGKRERASQDTSAVRSQLDSAERALVGLRQEADVLRVQLDDTRSSVSQIDPVETEAGRRWILLVTALVVLLGFSVLLAATYL
ncbi:MAG: Swt1 family HEPN domain-containing protein [Acidimicrobiales bacterium]|jgi:hypothetical protein|nr:Swt1 family HEPN domain-containing protein [Acidimicrobiales bacterium]